MTFNPNWVSSPNNTIKDLISFNNIDIKSLGGRLERENIRLNELLQGKIHIDKKVALILSDIFGNSLEFWINKQKSFDERVKNLDSYEKSDWIESLPIHELISEGFINGKKNIYEECLRFFNIKNIFDWKVKYLQNSNLSFRKSNGYDSAEGSVISWLRMGEIHLDGIKYPSYNRTKFEDKIQYEIKNLTRNRSPKIFIPQLVEICYSCGVKLSIQKAPKNCKVYGVTKFTNEGNPIMLLSFRYLADDQFWFTFFHEAGHIILHEGKFLNFEGENILDTDEKAIIQEQEANLFAEEVLIPYHLKEKLATLNSNQRRLLSFAMEANISPGIVVGQLQNKKYIKPSYLNGYKRRFDRDEINEAFKNSIASLSAE